MKSPQYTVEIERLVLTGLDLTPAQAEQVRTRLAGELQALLAGQSRAGGMADVGLEQVDLPALSWGEAQDPERLGHALAWRTARALPGPGDDTPVR